MNSNETVDDTRLTEATMNHREPFKTCPCCARVWPTRETFLADDALVLDGYSADLEILEQGIFYFTHKIPACNSTLALEVGDFMDLYPGSRYPEPRTGTPECPGYCLDRDQLARCSATCRNAVVREILQLLLNRTHRTAPDRPTIGMPPAAEPHDAP